MHLDILSANHTKQLILTKTRETCRTKPYHARCSIVDTFKYFDKLTQQCILGPYAFHKSSTQSK